MERDELLATLRRASQTISNISSHQQKITKLMDDIEVFETTAKKIEEMGNGALICPFAFGVLGIFGGLIGFIVGFIFGSIIYMMVFSLFFAKPKKRKAQKYYVEYVAPSIEELEKATVEFDSYLSSDDYKEVQNFIPQDYISLAAISWFIKAIENRRADNLKEAINLYENNQHQQRVEDMQNKQLALARNALYMQAEQLSVAKSQELHAAKAADLAEKIAKNSKKTANSVRYGNVLNTLSTIHHWNDQR